MQGSILKYLLRLPQKQQGQPHRKNRRSGIRRRVRLALPNILEHLGTSLRVMERLETSLHHLLTSCFENTLSKSKPRLPRWGMLCCFFVVAAAKKVMKSGKLGIANSRRVWYYEGATQLHIVPCL